MITRATFIRNSFLSITYVALLVLYLNNDSNRHFLGIVSDSFWLTGLSTLYIIFLLQKTEFRLSDAIFRIRKAEHSAIIYRVLGIPIFKRILQKYPMPTITLQFHLNSRLKPDIISLEDQMRKAEQVHVLGFLLILLLSVLFAVLRDVRFFAWFTLFNIVLNLYPIFLQRYNRNRVRVLLLKFESD